MTYGTNSNNFLNKHSELEQSKNRNYTRKNKSLQIKTSDMKIKIENIEIKKMNK